MTKATKAVILDVDGTLVDSNDAHAQAWVDAFGEAGIAVDYGRVRRCIGMGGDKLMPEVSGIEESTAQGRQISERRGEIFKSKYLPALRGFPAVRDLVARMKGDGFVVAVASSAKEDELQPLLEIAGAADLVPNRTSSDDAENSKPEPDIVQAALKAAGCEPSRAIMIGDTPYDVAAARGAGIPIVCVECGGWTREELQGASAVYRDPADLLAQYDRSPLAAIGRTS